MILISHKKAFTLVEMLIVIVIIGVLAAALIPRLTGIQARARDTARDADMRYMAAALEVYYLDHGEYPEAPMEAPNLLGRNKPLLYAQLNLNGGGRINDGELCSQRDPDCQGGLRIDPNIGTIGSQVFQETMAPYVTHIPIDKGNGLSTSMILQDSDFATEEGEDNNDNGFNTMLGCQHGGDYYAYINHGPRFVITSLKESRKGNTDNCSGQPTGNYPDSDGLYQNQSNISYGKLQEAEQGPQQILQLP